MANNLWRAFIHADSLIAVCCIVDWGHSLSEMHKFSALKEYTA